MKFAKVVFYVAGIYGLVSLLPLYFMFDFIGRNDPPTITHPQFYYGFVGVALAWQVAFFIIGSNPVRFRPFMLAAILEKLSYVVAVAMLYAQGKLNGPQAAPTLADLVLAPLFILAFVKTPTETAA